MVDRIVRQSDAVVKRTDRKVGIGLHATYRVHTETITDVDTGTSTQTYSDIEEVKVRSNELTIQDRIALSNAGLQDVSASWKIRKAYLDQHEVGYEPKLNDQLHLTVTDFTYVVLDSKLDKLQLDCILYTRRWRG